MPETDSPQITEDQRLFYQRQMRDRVCQTKAELKEWIELYLNTYLPDCTVDPDSNCNPLEMVWLIYKNMVHYNRLPEAERQTKFLFYATRGGFKTLNAAIVELLALIHDHRGTAHVGAGENHVKHCYNDYFQPYLRIPLIRERIASSIMEKTVLKEDSRVFVEIMPCTKKKTQGPHQPLVFKDEIDVVQDISAYNDIDGIAVNTFDGKPPVIAGISVRKSTFGLMQKEIDEAAQKGVAVYHWNLIDITERCPDTRSGTKPILHYIKRNSLYAIDETAFHALPFSEKQDYDPVPGYEHCLTQCKLFAACQGHLKNQTCTSPWLKSLSYTEKKLFESADEQMVIAQFLCRKPPSTGLIFPSYEKDLSEKTYSQMWEIFTKTKPDHEIEKDELIQLFHKHKIPCYFGVDWGFDPDPTVVLVMFIDRVQNIYVVDEFTAMRTSEAEIAYWLAFNGTSPWRTYYNPQLVFPDTSHPGGRKELEKVGFQCAGPKRLKAKAQKHGMKQNVIKDVKPGISVMRRFIRVPGTKTTKLFINPKACPLLAFELPRYHNEVNIDGTVKSDTPAKGQSDHAVDGSRYVLASLFLHGEATFALDADLTPDSHNRLALTRAPTPAEAGMLMGVQIQDASHLYEDDKEKADNSADEGFTFTF